MADLKVVIIGIVIFISLLGLIILSANIHIHQINAENTIVEATQTFLDTVSDRGSLTWRDYDQLVTALNSTGGTFEITVTIQRMFAIPDSSPLSPNYVPPDPADPQPIQYGFTRDYRPIYGFSSKEGSFSRIREAEHECPLCGEGCLDITHDQRRVVVGTGTIFMRRHD